MIGRLVRRLWSLFPEMKSTPALLYDIIIHMIVAASCSSTSFNYDQQRKHPLLCTYPNSHGIRCHDKPQSDFLLNQPAAAAYMRERSVQFARLRVPHSLFPAINPEATKTTATLEEQTRRNGKTATTKFAKKIASVARVLLYSQEDGAINRTSARHCLLSNRTAPGCRSRAYRSKPRYTSH